MSQPSNALKVGIKIFVMQLFAALISLLFMGTFVNFIGSNLGMKIYSTVTAGILLGFYYSEMWGAGKKDAKHVKVYNKYNEDSISINKFKWIVIAVIALIPNIIALATLIIADANGITNTIYRFFQCPFLGWLGDDGLTYIPNCVIITFIPPLFAYPAYITGTKEFSLMEKYLPKIVYVDKNKKKNKNKK